MGDLPYLFRQLTQELRDSAKDICTAMRAHFDAHGHATSSWNFDAVHGYSAGDSTQIIVEFLYEKGDEHRRIRLIGPSFRGLASKVQEWAAPVRSGLVREWLRNVFDCRDALTEAMERGDILGPGLVAWEHYGHRSDVVCVLDGTPVPKILDFPIEEVLPHRCFVHLVDQDGEVAALDAARECAVTNMRHGKIVGWIGDSPPSVRERRYWAWTGARSVEEAQRKLMMMMSAQNRHGEPTPPSLIVLVHPDRLPTDKEAQFSDPHVEPVTAVMWTNFLHNILLPQTTIVTVTSVPDVERYPEGLPVLLEPWRAVAKFERVYR